ENNDIGVPLTLLKAGPEHRAVVVEMGMRGLGEIDRLSRTAEPDVAVITNIGTAHIGRLGSREAIATAKCEITSQLKPDGLLVIPAGDPLLEQAIQAVWNGRVQRVALAGDPGVDQADLLGELDETNDLLSVRGERIRLPLAGRHNARNLLLAVAVAQELGVGLPALADLDVEVPGGRNRRLQLGGLRVLDETYNASPEAVLAALELLARQPGRRFAVLGSMLELGEQSVALHRQVAERAAALGLDGLVVVAGGGPIADALIAQVSLLGWDVAVETRPDLVEGLTTRLSSADAVVVMGHDVETSSRCLQVALDSDAGYIGALGSRAMQQARADWLAYRDVTDLTRVHGPAGLDIGAATPEEIAVSIVAQIVSARV
ncbi:MAG: hypothetical protein EBY47_06725, partial [Actinobacteria bacterium]|nr:hypothetical protein [Actinomycetota bacterium]